MHEQPLLLLTRSTFVLRNRSRAQLSLYIYVQQTRQKAVHSYVKFVTITNLVCWVLYNPCEHLGWLGELKIIHVVR